MNDHDLMTAMRESFTDVQSATPVEQIVSRSKAIRARRRALPGVVAVVAVAAAAGTAVALLPSGPAKPAPVATHTTAYVVSHVTRALDAMPDSTIMATQRVPVRGPIMDTWTDQGNRARHENFTRAGQPISDSGISFSSSPTGVTRIISVDYQNKTWSRSVQPYANGTPATTAVWTCSNVGTDDVVGNPHEMAAQLHKALSCGDLRVVGSGTVGGVSAVELSGHFSNDDADLTYWVNATTYLPFRFTAANGGTSVFRMKLQWLPPTAANLAKLNVPIPAGFTQVSPPGN
ncbi:MAG TPA: hypothetical protein VMC83_40865 [Streptosporangiaceae bacterium]|nr:hypothetical protein [Streptosporangiaceae bacterium]